MGCVVAYSSTYGLVSTRSFTFLVSSSLAIASDSTPQAEFQSFCTNLDEVCKSVKPENVSGESFSLVEWTLNSVFLSSIYWMSVHLTLIFFWKPMRLRKKQR